MARMKNALFCLAFLAAAAAARAAEPVIVAVPEGSKIVAVRGGKVKLTGPGEMTVSDSGIELKFGRLLLALPKLKGRKFAVRTQHAVAAVRGTEFYVEAGKDETYVCACEGRLAVGKTPLSAAKKARHKSKSFRDGKVVLADAGMRGHSDEEFPSLRGR